MGIKIEKAISKKQILFGTEPQMAVSVVVGADTDGVIKAGTPMTGNLTARNTAFVEATTDTETGVNNAVGVLLHDVKVEDGKANASLLIFGFVDLNKLESDVATKITNAVKTALACKVEFLK